MFVTEDLQEVSRDAQRAFEQERDRCVDRIAELDGYLKVLASINDLRMENERLKEELEQQRAENEEIRQQLDDKDIKLKELMPWGQVADISTSLFRKTGVVML